MKKNILKNIPTTPGIYFFKDKNEQILYIGKATNLKSRVNSYFASDIVKKRGIIIERMLAEVKKVEFQKTESVLEALILEANLIKKYQPKYNTKEKSDKSFVYLIITDEDFPRLIIKREKEFLEKKIKEKIKYFFGPFQNRHILQKALRIIRKIFPFFSRKGSYGQKSVIYQQMGYAPNMGISKEEYKKNILNIKLFFQGKKQKILNGLEKEMKEFAKKMEFEKASEVKKKIFALKYIKDVSLLENEQVRSKASYLRIEGYDVAHLQGTHMVGVMTVLEHGEINKSEYKKFNIRGQSGADDTKALREILERRFKHTE